MTKFMKINADGFPVGFYAEDVHGAKTVPVYGPVPDATEENPNPVAPVIGSEPNPDCKIPADAIEITDEQWEEFLDNQGRRRWVNGAIVEYTPPPAPVDLAAYAANARWETEVGGVAVAGIPIATDDRSKLMIVGARVAADADPNWTTQWAGSDGNVYPVNAAAMIAISEAVSAHVATCFATYATVMTEIYAGIMTTPAQIDAAFAAG